MPSIDLTIKNELRLPLSGIVKRRERSETEPTIELKSEEVDVVRRALGSAVRGPNCFICASGTSTAGYRRTPRTEAAAQAEESLHENKPEE